MPVTVRHVQARLDKILARLAPSNRQVDMAMQMFNVETEQRSRIFGGRWDTIFCRYVQPKETPLQIVERQVSQQQWEFIDEFFGAINRKWPLPYNHGLIIGGRRGQKTDTLSLWQLIAKLERPGVPGATLVKKMRKAKKYLTRKFIPQFGSSRNNKPTSDWLLPGKQGVKMSPDELSCWLKNGSSVEFLTGMVEDDARGEGVGDLAIDEGQIISQSAKDTAMASLSEAGDDFISLETATAVQGEFQDYYERCKKNPLFIVRSFRSDKNPWLSKKLIENMRSVMDPDKFRQEFLAEFVQPRNLVYWCYDDTRNGQLYKDARKVLRRRSKGAGSIPFDVGKDITREYLMREFGRGSRYLLGVDWNLIPMVAVVYKILRSPPGVGPIMWAIDEVILDEKADAARLAMECDRRGYGGSITIPDASGAYRNPADGDGEYSIRLFEQYGFFCYYHKTNPHFTARVDAVNAKLLNANDAVSLYIDYDKCPRLIKGLKNQKWRKDYKRYAPHGEDEEDHAHKLDAMGYPIAYLWPVAVNVADTGVTAYRKKAGYGR